ncbi:hypothetical protein DSO57_1035950 [Entomophthora muscae]|uniref:Uncharacterized protein n=1 Tax=Entomophthora muscae TaxID=34485 RepID=A0ACC2S195_9FUNG|nr:hypothetical protein DSO57_1035950 [Entomophthora muscae]
MIDTGWEFPLIHGSEQHADLLEGPFNQKQPDYSLPWTQFLRHYFHTQRSCNRCSELYLATRQGTLSLPPLFLGTLDGHPWLGHCCPAYRPRIKLADALKLFSGQFITGEREKQPPGNHP